MTPPIPPPPRRQRRPWVVPLVVALVLLVGGVGAYGVTALVGGVGDRTRSGGHPEMAEQLAASGLAQEFGGQGQQRFGERLGAGARAIVYEDHLGPGSREIPYERIDALVLRRGWSPHPCGRTTRGAVCWVKRSPEREGVTYELKVLPAEAPVRFRAEITELDG